MIFGLVTISYFSIKPAAALSQLNLFMKIALIWCNREQEEGLEDAAIESGNDRRCETLWRPVPPSF